MGSLAYAIVANTQQFTSGIVASKQELRTLKEAFLQSQTPVERYSAAIAHLESLAQKFPSKAQAVNATIAQMRREMFDASEAGQRLARQKELVTNVMGRMGLVLDPVSASFQAFNLAVGLAQTALQTFERIVSAVGDEMQRLDELAKKSATLGIDASSLVGLRRAAEDLSGVAADAFDQAFTIFTRRIGEAAMTGTGDAAKALERLSLNGTDLSAMAPDAAFLKVAEAIAKVQNPTERLTLAYQLLGRQGGELATTLAAGPVAIQALIERQQELSQIEFLDLEGIQEANDAIGEAQDLLQGIVSLLASEMSPLVKSITGDLTDGFDKASGKGEKLRSVMHGVAMATAILVDNIEFLLNKLNSPDFKNFINFASGGLIPLANMLADKVGESGGTIIAANAMSDPNSHTNELVRRQIEGALGRPGGETSRSAIGLGAEALEKQAKEAASAAAKADAAIAKAQAAHEKRNAEEDAIDKLRDQFKKDEQKEILERIKQADKVREDIRKRTETLKDGLRTPAEELAKDLKELMDLQAAGLDKATFGKGLLDLRSKARDLAGKEDVRPQAIGAVRAGSIEALRSQFEGRNVSEKQLEEQRKAVAEAAVANTLLNEIKTALAANQLKEAL